MEKILGLPRNAAIVIGAVIVSAAALAAGLLIPWGNNTEVAGDTVASTMKTPGAPSPAEAPAAPGTRAAATSIRPADPLFTGIDFKRITVDFDNLPADQAMQAFSDAAAIQVDQGAGAGGRGPVNAQPLPVSMHLKNAPFLEGLLQLANNTRTMPQEITDSHAALRSMSDAAVGKWSVSGPLAVVVQRIQTSADLTRSLPSSMQGMVYFDFYSDPAVKIAQYPATLSFDQFEDEKHQVLFAGSAYGSSTGGRNLPRASMQMPMSLPLDHGRKIAIMRGSAVFTLALHTESIQTTGPTDTLTQTVGEVGIEIRPITSPVSNGPVPLGAINRNFTMAVRYHRKVADPEKWNRLVNIISRIQPQVFDAADTPLQGNFYASNSDRQDAEVMTQNFVLQINSQQQAGVEPHHVRFEFPVEMREVRVPFEFKDLILP